MVEIKFTMQLDLTLGKFVYEVDKDNDLVDIVFTIEKVVRDGRTFPQIRVKDIKSIIIEISDKLNRISRRI